MFKYFADEAAFAEPNSSVRIKNEPVQSYSDAEKNSQYIAITQDHEKYMNKNINGLNISKYQINTRRVSFHYHN